MKSRTVCLWQARITVSSLTETTVSTQGEPVKVKPSMMIWSMLVQCKCVEDQTAIKETVESLNRIGYPELTVRSEIKELKERFGVRANRTSSTKIRFCVSWHGGTPPPTTLPPSNRPPEGCDTSQYVLALLIRMIKTPYCHSLYSYCVNEATSTSPRTWDIGIPLPFWLKVHIC